MQAAQALGVDPARLLKTLMRKAGSNVVCVLAPSDREVSLKKLAAGRKQDAAMLKPAEAERFTGYRVGGISPFGQKKRVNVSSKGRHEYQNRDLQWRGGRACRSNCRGELVRLLDASPRRYAHEHPRPLPPSMSRSMAASPSPGALPGSRSISGRNGRAGRLGAMALRHRGALHARIAAIRASNCAFRCATISGFALLGSRCSAPIRAVLLRAQWVTSGLLSVVFSLASIIHMWLGALLLGTPVNRRTVIGGFLGRRTGAMFFRNFPAPTSIPKC